MFKILICDKLAEQGIDVFRSDADCTVDIKLGLSPAELKMIVGDYDALVVRSETQITADIISEAKNVKVIGRAGVGLDNVDIPAATRAGIIVMNTPDGNTISAAEHTMALLLSMARNIPQARESLRAKKWERSKFTGIELLGKTLGIIGLGRIGGEVAKRAKSFGMHLISYDPYARPERARELDVELCDLDTLLKRSDIITVHVPITTDTSKLIGEEELKVCKDRVKLVNVARGGIYDESALADALRSGKVAAAALDVFTSEPPFDNPLLEFPNVIATPHLGASTEEAQINVAIVVAKQIVDALHNRTIFNAVNVPAIDAEQWKYLQPFYDLCQKLATFLSQISHERITAIKITYAGDVAHLKTQALTLVILRNLLAPYYQENVNYVNAPVLAKERGIEITESTTDHFGNYINTIHLQVDFADSTHTIRGTVLNDASVRIVEVDSYRVDISTEGMLLMFFNPDVPGILGKVSTILGNAGVNIAGLANGRGEIGSLAVTIINLDSDVPPDALQEISAIEGLSTVRLIKL